jgi:hypothetical protein
MGLILLACGYGGNVGYPTLPAIQNLRTAHLCVTRSFR